MPAYEYACQGCGHHFERRQKMSDAEVADCPECGGAVKRLISGGAGVISKGGAVSAPRGCGATDAPCPGAEMGCGNACGWKN